MKKEQIEAAYAAAVSGDPMSDAEKRAAVHRLAADVPATVITEGVSGTYYYHMSDPGSQTVALCGAFTMPTSLAPATWGVVGHLQERYCSRCEAAAVARQGRR